MRARLTKRQREVYEHLCAYRRLHGYSPTLVELAELLGVSAVSTVHEHLLRLEAKGWIDRGRQWATRQAAPRIEEVEVNEEQVRQIVREEVAQAFAAFLERLKAEGSLFSSARLADVMRELGVSTGTSMGIPPQKRTLLREPLVVQNDEWKRGVAE